MRNPFRLGAVSAPLALCLWLAGCALSTQADRNGQQLWPPAPGIDTTQAERLIAAGAPRLRITLLDQGPSVLMVETGARDGVTRWRTIDNAQIYLRDGLIIGTRGLSFDLMTADTAEAAAAIHGGYPARITRIHSYLDGQDRMRIRSYVCDVTPAGQESIRLLDGPEVPTQRIDEACRGPEDDFTNVYWLRGGRVAQSVQFISEGVGRAQVLFPSH
ncbi:YjbF family lipoprotein [Amaricoccus solimangrovi]|uniref:YjbF family lipoprotein n=1 Tax=Amaricoccus solimangrovi TaxID=2589815 RepID=A0A501WIB8_9RHOB|nr:YjbF family lipoprotein [Amaricoccus solimangrovi]TPE49118.1 YjbF family lipoprotein [Amaricoccus solimangrovi]